MDLIAWNTVNSAQVKSIGTEEIAFDLIAVKTIENKDNLAIIQLIVSGVIKSSTVEPRYKEVGYNKTLL